MKAALPDAPVVGFCGDGGFYYHIAELETALRFGINAIMVVFNDGAYGNVRRMQKERFNNRVIGSDLLNPDFMKLADSFGMAGRRAHGPEELRGALQGALKENHPTLIEVPVGEWPSTWSILRGS